MADTAAAVRRAVPPAPTEQQAPLVSFLADHPLFGVAPPETLDRLAETALVRHYARGHHIWQPGDLTAHVGVLRSGLVSITDLDERGSICSVMTKGPGDVLAPLITMNRVVQYGWTTPLLDSEVVLIPKEEFEALFRSCPDFAVGLLHYVSQMFARFRRTIVNRTSMSTTSRVAAFLLELTAPDDTPPGSPSVALALSHRDLALLLGTTRETITRTLRQFARAGLISVSRRKIEILNPAALREIALS